MFKVGDRIVYPMHGAGFIEAIVKKVIGGIEREYYELSMIGANIRLSIPVENNGAIRLRSLIDKAEAERVLAHFRSAEIDMSVPWGRRYKENVDRMKSGNPFETAEVLKTLMLRDKNVGLSTGDRQVIVMARQILCSELSIALERDREDILYEFQAMLEA